MNCMLPIRSSMLSRRTHARKTPLYILSALLLLLAGCAPKSLAPEALNKGVRFSFYAPSATSVSIAGSFNRWDPRINALAGPGRDGVWTIVLPLPPDRYEYRFVVNGKDWVLDPFSPSADDGLGERNSVFVLPGDAQQ
jgi:1,4-alpha-glucan branching enzyme